VHRKSARGGSRAVGPVDDARADTEPRQQSASTSPVGPAPTIRTCSGMALHPIGATG
jgi:hypothetical protein